MEQESLAPAASDTILVGQIFGQDARPTSSYKKAAPPILGEAFGSRWNNSQIMWQSMPGGGVVGFDLNRLTLADFRMMRDHYQVNASLSVLAFMMHQLQWSIESDSKKVRDHVTVNMKLTWTRLVRALSQAFWAGYSPNVLQWENDLLENRVMLTKIKDLIPEESLVNWKYVDGWAPPDRPKPKLAVYDGIKQISGSYPIPPDNTLWYPLLMENGDMYGRKLLRPAFTSWFFSIIIHLFANRYFERYGEPTILGRAPYDDEIDVDGKKVPGRQVMLDLLMAVRNRGAVVLPSQKETTGLTGSQKPDFEYDMEYLESQMRGADFERYLMRLDEEISLALFTPLLMLRTADVGSYNLGTTHAQVYLQMLNALAGDWKEYIDHYVLKNMVNYNFGEKAPRAYIKFRKLGDDRMDLVKSILQQLLARPNIMPDLAELGEMAGLTLNEVEVVTEAPPAPDPNADPTQGGNNGDNNALRKSVVTQMLGRLRSQVTKALREGELSEEFVPSLGFERQLEDALVASGAVRSEASQVHRFLTAWVGDLAGARFESPDQAMQIIQNGLESKVEELCGGQPARTS